MTNFNYSMDEAVNVSIRASLDIEKYLRSLPNTTDVINVEKDPFYMEKDIDILWTYNKNGHINTLSI